MSKINNFQALSHLQYKFNEYENKQFYHVIFVFNTISRFMHYEKLTIFETGRKIIEKIKS